MIIGFTGKARSGKNTAAEFLADFYSDMGWTIKTHSFAAKLKQSAAACFGIRPDYAIEWCDHFKQDMTVEIPYYDLVLTGREFLQNYGTEAHRDIFSEEFWVDSLMNDIDTHDQQLDLITDVRFDNEAEAIKSNNGAVVRLNRQEANSNDSHASEQRISSDLVDVEIYNDSSLDNFRKSVITVCSELMSELYEMDYSDYLS